MHYLGFDWSNYTAAHSSFDEQFGGKDWWPSGPRRCWDELAILSRLVTKESLHGDRTLAHIINMAGSDATVDAAG